MALQDKIKAILTYRRSSRSIFFSVSIKEVSLKRTEGLSTRLTPIE